MNKKEIIKNLTAFVDAENELAIKEAINIIAIFEMLLLNEKKEYERLSKEDKNSDDLVNPLEDEENKSIIDLIEKFKKKRIQKAKSKKDKEAENLQLKRVILNDFKALIETNKNIGELINGIKAIREQWSNVGSIPRDVHTEIQAAFSKLNDEFNYNINIYKELKENDLKINYSLKNQIIHELNELKDEANIKQLENQLRSLQNKWEEIGPTFKDHWEELKSNYWNNIHLLYDKIKAHYKEQKSNQSENLKIKTQFITEISNLTQQKYTTHKEWEKLTAEVKSIQEKWKSTGPVSKKENEKIWKEFREHCDQFFNAKKEFYNDRNQTHKKHADQKKSLIDDLDKVLKNENFKETVNGIKQLQEKWKKIGHAGKHAEQKLWHSFRSKCDAFFENKNNETKNRKTEEAESIKQKMLVIEQVKTFDTKTETANDKLHEFIEKFKTTGKASFNKSKPIFEEFKGLVLKKFEELNISLKEKEELLSQLKMIHINDSFNPEKTLQFERERIKKKINQTMKEVLNYENNLGFFNNSSGNSSILNSVTSNIEKGKKEIEKLKSELKNLKL